MKTISFHNFYYYTEEYGHKKDMVIKGHGHKNVWTQAGKERRKR